MKLFVNLRAKLELKSSRWFLENCGRFAALYVDLIYMAEHNSSYRIWQRGICGMLRVQWAKVRKLAKVFMNDEIVGLITTS